MKLRPYRRPLGHWAKRACGETEADYSPQVLSVVSEVRRRRDAEEQDRSERRRIPDTTT